MAQPKDKMSEIDEHIAKVFSIQKRLGKGAYGIVWKAQDRKTKAVVAVKKIFDAFRNQTDAQRTFREIIFLKAFKGHPNIIQLFSVHRAANNKDIYLGFEYMETDLHNVIKKGNILRDVHKRFIMYQLLKAIKFIHSGNVIHRDLKPSNVLLDSSCKCKIADFGLARTLNQNSEGSIGSTSDPTLTDYVATRWYRAPEILIANKRYTKGIDMWSLGCILAEMIAGKPIFPGSSSVNQIEKIMATIPTPSQQDITTVCISGVGSSMIKNASNVQKIAMESLLGRGSDEEAVDLINQLLIFNPLKRLTAEYALNHPYVLKFHDPQQEITMENQVTIPLNDDVRLAIDDYRNKLYELMSTGENKIIKVHTVKSKIIPDIHSKVSKCAEKYLKSHVQIREKPCISHSEPKIKSLSKTNYSVAGNIKSDSKVIAKCNVQFNQNREQKVHQAGGDSQYLKMTSKSEVSTRMIGRKQVINPTKKASHLSFNSYNKNHGIITESALMELRAAGFR